MKKCKNCNCDCHCDGDLHSDVYGVCTCDNCKCREVKEEPVGVVVDDTGECESCQQWVGLMNYYFTGILIILLILLALFGGPNL